MTLSDGEILHANYLTASTDFLALFCSTFKNIFTDQLRWVFELFPYSTTYNPFHTTDLFWYPLKTLESLSFFNVFRGIKRDHWHEMD